VAQKLRAMEAKLKATVAAAQESAAELDVDGALATVMAAPSVPPGRWGPSGPRPRAP
jgi:hypothetical protein